MRRVLVIALALALAGCTATLEPIGEPVRAPALDGNGVIMADGAILPLHVHLPDGDPKAIILALHGFNDYGKAFDKPGEFFAARGIATYAYDQRGFGEAPEPGRWFGTKTMVDDAHTVAGLLRQKYPGAKLFLMGESMGGAVALNAAASGEANLFDGVILISPAAWGREAMSGFERGGLWFFSNTMAWFPVSGSSFHLTPTSNDAVLLDLSRDPNVRKQTSFGTLAGLVDLMDGAQDAAPRLTVPTLMLFGDRDEVVPPRPTCLLLSRLAPRPPGAWRAAFYPEGYHMLLRDLDGELVMSDIQAWIAQRTAPLPSGNEVLTAEGETRERQLNTLFFCRPHKEG